LSCCVLVGNTVFSRAIRIELARWQAHLNDGTTLERLDALMPKVFGITWATALGNPSVPL
jgi:hypothetical protein